MVLDAVTAPEVPVAVSTANLKAADVPPPGAGLKMVTSATPTVARSAAVREAVNCEMLTKVVGRGEPFQFTTAPGAKFVPLMVSEMAPEFAWVSTGVRLATPGTTAEIVREPAPTALL